MSTVADAVELVRFRQRAAALAIADLSRLDLPELFSWKITTNRPVSADIAVSAQLAGSRSDAERLAAVYTWAEFLGSRMRSKDHGNGKVHVSAAGEHMGVQISIWIYIDQPAPAGSEAADAR